MQHGNGLSGGSFLFQLSSLSSRWLCWLANRMMTTTMEMGRKSHRARISFTTIDTEKQKLADSLENSGIYELLYSRFQTAYRYYCNAIFSHICIFTDTCQNHQERWGFHLFCIYLRCQFLQCCGSCLY